MSLPPAGAVILRPLRLLRAIALSAAAIAGVYPGAARAEEVPISARAREHFQRGVSLLEAPGGPRYDEAYEAFKAAYQDSPSPKILGNLGLCAAELERDAEAIDAYRRYLDAADVDPEERRDIEVELRQLEAGKADLTLSGLPPGARIVDERQPPSGRNVINRYGPVSGDSVTLGVRAGRHRVVIEATDGRQQTLTVQLRPGEQAARAVDFDEPAGDDDDDDDDGEGRADFPAAYVARPMTLPEHVLAPALGVHMSHSYLAPDIGFGLDLVNASFGILDSLELSAALLPLEIQPEADYGTSWVGLTFRYLDAVVELGTSLRLGHFRGPDERHFFIEPSLIDALFHLGGWGRIDAGFRFHFVTRSPVTIGMRLPVRMALQPVEVVYLGVATGMGIYDFDIAKDTLFIPLGAFVGFTVPSDERPLVDVETSFGFDQLFVPGGDGAAMGGLDKVDPATYRGQLLIRVYFQL